MTTDVNEGRERKRRPILSLRPNHRRQPSRRSKREQDTIATIRGLLERLGPR